jgi:hypothetical protein
VDESNLAVLAKAAHALNKAGVVWGVGASALLFLSGLVEEYNDIDLIIAPECEKAARKALEGLGAKAAPPAAPSAAYETQSFTEYTLAGVDFDLLCGFAIRRRDGLYTYDFWHERIAEWVDVLGARAPLCPLEDWFVLYLLMPGRQKRATLIGRHVKQHPRERSRAWLNRWLSNRLPGDVRERVMTLYNDIGSGGKLLR